MYCCCYDRGKSKCTSKCPAKLALARLRGSTPQIQNLAYSKSSASLGIEDPTYRAVDFTFSVRLNRSRRIAPIALNIKVAFDILIIEDKLERVGEANLTALFSMSHVVDGSAADNEDAIDFDLAQWEKVNWPEAEAMREACASGDLIAVQSVFKTHWQDRSVDERIDLDKFGASGLCEAIKQDDFTIAHYLLLNMISMQQVHFAMATEYHAYSILQLYMDAGWDINTFLGRMQPPALS